MAGYIECCPLVHLPGKSLLREKAFYTQHVEKLARIRHSHYASSNYKTKEDKADSMKHNLAYVYSEVNFSMLNRVYSQVNIHTVAILHISINIHY